MSPQLRRSGFHHLKTPPKNDPAFKQPLRPPTGSLLTRLCRQILLERAAAILVRIDLLGFSLNKQRQFDAALKAYRRSLCILAERRRVADLTMPTYLSSRRRIKTRCPSGGGLNSARSRPSFKLAEWLLPDLCTACTARRFEPEGCHWSYDIDRIAFQRSHRRHPPAGVGQSAEGNGRLGSSLSPCVRPPIPATTPTSCCSCWQTLGDDRAAARQLETFGAVFACKPHWPSFETSGEPWQGLKIGFLARLPGSHAAAYFTEGTCWLQLDRRQFEVFSFYLLPKSDHVTERVKPAWTTLCALRVSASNSKRTAYHNY